MSVTQQLMRLGSFDLVLRDDTPKSIRGQIDAASDGVTPDHIVITNVPVDIAALSDSVLLAGAAYTGVLLDNDGYNLSGCSVLWWWGSDQGVGPWFASYSGTPTFVTDGVTYTLTGTNVFDVVSVGAGTLNGLTGVNQPATASAALSGPVAGTAREFVDFLCGLYGVEYHVSPDFNITFAVTGSSILFRQTPTVLITRKGGGDDGGYRGITGPNLLRSISRRNMTTTVTAVDPAGQSASSTAGTVPKGPDNVSVSMIRRIASDTLGGSTTAAAAVLNLYTTPEKKLTVDTSEWAIPRFVRAGDYVYIYDPDNGMSDLANQIVYRGETIFPIKYRVMSHTWEIEDGMGVYLRKTGATATYVDLTDWIVWETSSGSFGDQSQDAATRFTVPAPVVAPEVQSDIPAAGIQAINGPATGPGVISEINGPATADGPVVRNPDPATTTTTEPGGLAPARRGG